MTDHEVIFTRHNERHWREFTVRWDGGRAAFNVIITDLSEGLSWWLTLSDVRSLVDALERKLDALDLEALPPIITAPIESNMPPWLTEDKDD